MANPSALLLPPFGFSKPSTRGLVDPLGLKPEAPSLPPAPTVPDADTAAAAARKKQRLAAFSRKGRASTILTGGAGVVGQTPLLRPQALGA